LPLDYAAIAHIFDGELQSVSQSAPEPAKTQPQPAAANTANKASYGETPISQLPKALAALMFEYNVTEAELQQVVAQRGYFPADTPILNYGEDFINGKLVTCWPQVYGLIKQNR